MLAFETIADATLVAASSADGFCYYTAQSNGEGRVASTPITAQARSTITVRVTAPGLG